MTTPLQIALAELMGWENIKLYSDFFPGYSHVPAGNNPITQCLQAIPLLDDNFLRLAREKLLVDKILRIRFVNQLAIAVWSDNKPDQQHLSEDNYDLINAPCDIQAEVLVRMFKTKE